MVDDNNLSVITITAGLDTKSTIDIASCFDSMDMRDHMGIALATHESLQKTRPNSDLWKSIKVGASSFRNQMTLFVSNDAGSFMKCRVFGSGKFHVVGAKSFDDVRRAMDVMLRVTRITGTYSIDIYMMNVGFQTVPIDRHLACEVWNRHCTHLGFACLNTERFAALKILLTEPVGACVMVFRTGKVQLTGKLKSWDDVLDTKRVWDTFIHRFGHAFSSLL
jgi:TATA-box binding protein (TBP) (component of TFIID and TFIIIB)